MMKRVILMAGALVIVLAVGVCVHAATTNAEKATVPMIADDTVIQKQIDGNDTGNYDSDQAPAAEVPASTAPADEANTQPADPQPVETRPAVKQNDKWPVTEDAAKKTALTHAGIRESDTSYIFVMREYDDGFSVYNVEFQVGAMEYEYEIDANSGAIMEFDSESIYD